MTDESHWIDAPGAPGVEPTWASSDKDFVTTALSGARLWATIGHGMLNEVYWPSTGDPRMRDLVFLLLGEAGWVDLKRVCRYTISRPGPTIPLVTVRHTGDLKGVPYALDLEFLPDTERDAILIRYAVEGPFRLVAIAAPHLDGDGAMATAHAMEDGTALRHERHRRGGPRARRGLRVQPCDRGLRGAVGRLAGHRPERPPDLSLHARRRR